MLSPFHVIVYYTLIVVSIPFIISSTNLGDIIPRLAQHFNINYYYYKIEPIALCLGLITLYTYVFLGFISDVIQQQESYSNVYLKLQDASRQLRKLYPAFIVSSVLLYNNTNRFDSLRNSFIMFQVILLIVLPFTYLSSKPTSSLICKFMYRSVLFWSLIYALFPRETQYYIYEITHLFNVYLGLESYPYYQRNRYHSSNYDYSDYLYMRQGNQQWAYY